MCMHQARIRNGVERAKGSSRGKERWDIAGSEKGVSTKKDGVRSSSFFVTEFGDKWLAKYLFYEFMILGEIDEVVIPLRRDKK